MTDEQIEMLRWLIKGEIEAAGIDGMEHGVWGYAERQLDEGWKEFKALNALDNLYTKNDKGMERLAND